MSEVTRVVVDAMGGDYAPEWIIRGAVEAINEGAKAQVILTGKEDVIKKELGITLSVEEINAEKALKKAIKD